MTTRVVYFIVHAHATHGIPIVSQFLSGACLLTSFWSYLWALNKDQFMACVRVVVIFDADL